MIRDAPIDPPALLAAFAAGVAGAGAVVSFTGVVRGGDVRSLELDHHPTFTVKAIAAIAADCRARFELADCLIVHRVGTMVPGDPIVFVAAAAAHRRAAFEALDYLMDRLKTEAPLWKREVRGDGAEWIEPRAVDHRDRARWEPVHADR